MDESSEEEDNSTPVPTISNAHVVILRTNLSNEEIDKIFLDIAMALRSAGHIVSFLCCHIDAEISDHMRDFDVSKVFRWIPSSMFGFFKTPLRLLSSALIIIWLRMFRNYVFPSFVITDSFVVLPILRRIGVNVIHFYQFEGICRRNNFVRRLMVPFERWFLNHANKILIENRTSVGMIQRIYKVPLPTEVLYLTAAYDFLEQDIDVGQVVISRLPPNVHYFLVSGIYGPKLNCDTLIKSFELLLDRILSGPPCTNRKNVYLIISGYVVDSSSLKYFNNLKNYTHELRYESKILLFKDMEILIQKYLIANCAAVLIGETDMMSCSNILECLSVGTIVMSAKSDYAEELITHQITGFLIDPTPENYCELMLKVLDNEIFVGYMKYMIVLDYFNRFSFSALEQQLQKIVENMVNIFNERRAYRYLSPEAYRRYLTDTLQLLKDRHMFEREGPMTGSQLKEMLFQMQMQIIQRNSQIQANERRDSTDEEVLVIDLDRQPDEQDPRDLSPISNILSAVQLRSIETEPQPGTSGSILDSGGQSRENIPSPSNYAYLTWIDPRLNKQKEPKPGPSYNISSTSLKEITTLHQQDPLTLNCPSLTPVISELTSSSEEPQTALSNLSSLTRLLVTAQSSNSNYLTSPENILTPTISSGKLHIEQQLFGLYDQFIVPNEIKPQENPQVSDVIAVSPPPPPPIPTNDKGKRKMGTKIGEGRKKTSKPQMKIPDLIPLIKTSDRKPVQMKTSDLKPTLTKTSELKSTQDNKDTSTVKPGTVKKSTPPEKPEKKLKPKTQSDSVVCKKLPPLLNKDKPKLTKTSSIPEKQQSLPLKKSNIMLRTTLPNTPDVSFGSGRAKTPKPLSRGGIVQPSVSKDKSNKSMESISSIRPTTDVKLKSSKLPTTPLQGSRFQSKPPSPLQGSRFQPHPSSSSQVSRFQSYLPTHGSPVQGNRPPAKQIPFEKILSPSAPVGGIVVTNTGGRPKPSTSIGSPVIKSRVPPPSPPITKRKPPQKNIPAKISEEKEKSRTSTSKTARTRKPVTPTNVLPPPPSPSTSKPIKKPTKDPEVNTILHPENPPNPVLEETCLPESTISLTSNSEEKRTMKRRQTPQSESDTKRLKLESTSLPDLRTMALESEVSVRRSEPLNIKNILLPVPPLPVRIPEKKFKKIFPRHSPRIKLVPVTSVKLDTSTLRSTTLTQIISPRRSRRSVGSFVSLKPRSLSSRTSASLNSSSPRLLVKGRSILMMPRTSKSRSPRGAYKLEPTSSEEQTRDFRRPLRKTPAVTDLRICRLRRRCRFCTFRYVPVQRLPTGELPITTVFPPSGVESESSIEGMEPADTPREDHTEKKPKKKGPSNEDAFKKH